MPILTLGNTSVLETVKPDPGTNATETVARPELGQQVTTMHLNEDTLAKNIATAVRFWRDEEADSGHSDEPPAWLESDDPAFAAILAQELGCEVGRPKKWVMGPQPDAKQNDKDED